MYNSSYTGELVETLLGSILTQEQISELILTALNSKIQLVSALPANPESDVLYLIPE